MHRREPSGKKKNFGHSRGGKPGGGRNWTQASAGEFEDFDGIQLPEKNLSLRLPDPGEIKLNADIVAIGESKKLSSVEKLERFSSLLRRTDILSPATVSAFAYQAARLGISHDLEFGQLRTRVGTELAGKCIGSIGSFGIRELSSTLRGVSDLKVTYPEFYMEGVRAAVPYLAQRSANVIDVVDLVIATAQSDFRSPDNPDSGRLWRDFWSEMLPVVDEMLPSFNLNQIARITIELQMIEESTAEIRFTQTIANLVTQLASGLLGSDEAILNPPTLRLAAKAFAAANIERPGVFEKISKDALIVLSELSLRPLSDIVHSFGRMNYYPKHFCDAARRKIDQSPIHPASGRKFVNMAWAFAVADDRQAFNWAWNHVKDLAPTTSWDEDDINRMFVAADVMGAEIPECLKLRTRAFVASSNETRNLESRAPRSSWFHLEIEAVLRRLGVGFKHEARVPDHIWSLDILLTGNDGSPVAIECNGTRFHHVGRDRNERLLGNTVLKKRSLEQQGYKVIFIDNVTWAEARNSGRERQLIVDLLSGAGIHRQGV